MGENTNPIGGSPQEEDSILVAQEDSKWRHALLILLFAFVYQISEVVFAAVALFQVVYMLITGGRNENLNEFSTRLTSYMYVVLQYVCMNSSELPWPLEKPDNKIEIIES